MNGLLRATAVARKDLLVEWRGRQTATATGMVALLMILLLGFVLGSEPARAAAILWVALGFAAVLGIPRVTQAEVDQQALETLLLYPGSREHLYWGKCAALIVMLSGLLIALLVALAWLVLWALTIASLGLLSPLLLTLGFIPVLYHTLSIGGPHSATPGMRLTGIEVRSWTGEPPSYLQAFVQTILFYVTVYPTWSLVLLVALFNPRRRTLHDILAGTLVIRRFPAADVVAAR